MACKQTFNSFNWNGKGGGQKQFIHHAPVIIDKNEHRLGIPAPFFFFFVYLCLYSYSEQLFRLTELIIYVHTYMHHNNTIFIFIL